MRLRRLRFALALVAVHALAACGDDDGETPPAEWQVVHEDLDRALMAVWGTSEEDVWAVGAAEVPEGDEETCAAGECAGPIVLHWDGAAWDEQETEADADLWWVFGFPDGPIYAGGAGGQIVRDDGSGFEAMATPNATPIVFGIWGCSPDDVWAVGGNLGGGGGGFAWHLEGGEWVDHPLPEGPMPGVVLPVWKVIGKSCDDVRFVGEGGFSFHWNGSGFAPEPVGLDASFFTVVVADDCYVAVGGLVTGVIFEDCGSGWQDVSPEGASTLNGICSADGATYATGFFGATYRRDVDGTWVLDVMPPTSEILHACWIDPSGGLWSVGGQVVSIPRLRGVMVYRGGLDFAASGS